jgi:hypothetical protein
MGIKYLNISSNLDNVTEIRIELHYTDDEVREVDESSLAVFYWNGSGWINCTEYSGGVIPAAPNTSIEDLRVYEAGNNPDENYVYAVVNHTSDYGLGGNYSIPSPVTNLAHTAGKTWVNWTWKDPDDLDFDHVMIYIDGEFMENVTKGVQFYYATGFSSGTGHTISTRTVDTTGLLSEWNNLTAKTESEPSPPAGGGRGGGGGGLLLPTPTPSPTQTPAVTPQTVGVTPAVIPTMTPTPAETPLPTTTPELTITAKPAVTPSPAWWRQPTGIIAIIAIVVAGIVIIAYAFRRR